MDIIAARQGVEYARQWVTEGKGPLLMEFVTYRYGGHSWVLSTRVTHPFFFFLSFWSLTRVSYIVGCPTQGRPTALAKKSRGCVALRILSVVYNGTSRSGVWLPSRNSRWDPPSSPSRTFINNYHVIDARQRSQNRSRQSRRRREGFTRAWT